MTNHPESRSSNENSWLIRHTKRHVERHLDRGDLVFRARPLMAALAIFMTTGENFTDAMESSQQAVLDTLREKNIEGEIFALWFNGPDRVEYGADRVRLTAIGGVATDARYSRLSDTPRVLIRATTHLPEAD